MGKRNDNAILTAFNSPADATVESILNEETRRRDEMQLSPEERKHLIEQRRKDAARKQAAQEKARSQNRVTLILPPDLSKRIEGIAHWQGVTSSQVVTFFLYETLTQYERGAIRFDEFKQPSYSPRYDFELIHPQDTTRQNRRSAKKQKTGWG
jgi:hypothetical protein